MLRVAKKKKNAKKINKVHQDLLNHYGSDILNSKNFIGTSKNTQHGSMSVLQHSINVAKYSLLINEKLGIHCKTKDLIRGALLHDYFLYDWHDKNHVQLYRLHGFHHPSTALKNASKEYKLSPREKDIIKKHMWPLTIKPPLCREAWVVTTADKYCSLLETLRIHKEKKK
ncbi:MAG: HD domain-containing protein [Lachnospiraceae bacterium]|nr:HD domain-containing protein [Lachnospiraceae bacterium]